jgi:hypothetical protein
MTVRIAKTPPLLLASLRGGPSARSCGSAPTPDSAPDRLVVAIAHGLSHIQASVTTINAIGRGESLQSSAVVDRDTIFPGKIGIDFDTATSSGMIRRREGLVSLAERINRSDRNEASAEAS